jgi:stage V sporulation protein R
MELVVGCTAHHKWMVLNGVGGEWKETTSISSGDKILAGGEYEQFLNVPAKIVWSKYKVFEETLSNVRNRLKEIDPPKEMTLELAELLGICAGDGSQGVSGAENAIAVASNTKHNDYVNHISNLMLKVFGINPSVYHADTSCSSIQLNSKYAVDYFNEVGMKKGITFESKVVPLSIWQSSNEYRAAYLRGIFDTDGYVGKYLSMSSKSVQLVNDVQGLLLEMGIKSEITHVLNKHNDIYVLVIKHPWNKLLFYKHIGFSLKYKQDKLENLLKGFHGAGRGFCFPLIQEEIISRIKYYKPYNKLPTWVKRFVRMCEHGKMFHQNALWAFTSRLIMEDYGEFVDLQKLLEIPMYEVQSVEEAGESETYDIALDHDHHDFIANGLITHNTNPCVMYVMASNTMVDNVTVVAHATGHNDFFKNNIFFTPTDESMMNKLANNGTRIRKYISRWGRERVTEFIDHVLRIQTLIDPAKAWTEREIREPIIKDKRDYDFPRRLKVDSQRLHMDPWINPDDFIESEYKRIQRDEMAHELELFENPEKDVFGFLKNYAHLKPWQQDIISMLYEEAMYFSPQRATKTLNEGWASFIDYELMTRQGLVSMGQKSKDMGIVEYAVHKMGVLGGKYSTNPYKTGFYLLLDIEERWNRGQFGREWEECKDLKQKEEWDLKLNLGKKKVFEVRKYYNDVTFINEFFTQEFCDKFEYFEYKHYPNGEWKIENRDAKKIKRKMLQRHVNGGLPDIRVVDPNHRNKNYLLLQHYPDIYDDRELYDPYARAVLTSIHYLWGREVMLATKNKNKEEFVYVCVGTDPQKDVMVSSREDYEKTWV